MVNINSELCFFHKTQFAFCHIYLIFDTNEVLIVHQFQFEEYRIVIRHFESEILSLC